MTALQRAHDIGVIGCPVCGLVLDLLDDDQHPTCPRCHSALHRRHLHSLARTWLLLAIALLLYVPSNLFPVMAINLLGHGDHETTIIGGVLDLWQGGSHDIAAVVFMASVVLPCSKFVVLAGLLVSVQNGATGARRQRAKLLRLLELIGCWSMLDVLVVGVLGSLVQFQALGEIEPRAGIFLFGASVVFTMLAAHSFDPRLIWDDPDVPR